MFNIICLILIFNTLPLIRACEDMLLHEDFLIRILDSSDSVKMILLPGIFPLILRLNEAAERIITKELRKFWRKFRQKSKEI